MSLLKDKNDLSAEHDVPGIIKRRVRTDAIELRVMMKVGLAAKISATLSAFIACESFCRN